MTTLSRPEYSPQPQRIAGFIIVCDAPRPVMGGCGLRGDVTRGATACGSGVSAAGPDFLFRGPGCSLPPSSTWTDTHGLLTVQHPDFRVFRSYSRPFVRLQAGPLSRPTFTRRTPIYHQSNPSLHFVSLYPPIALSSSSPPQNEQILNGLCIKDVVPATVKVSLGKGPASEHFDSAVPQISITRSFRHLSFSTTHPL